MKSLCIIVAAALLASTAFAQGWGDAHFGMTPAEIKNVYPQAKLAGDTHPRRKNDLEFHGLKIGIGTYNVRFYFDAASQLSSISLILDNGGVCVMGGTADIKSDELRDKLVEKYGAPTSASLQPGNRSWMWVKEGMVIKLSHLVSSCFVCVQYKRPEEESESRKL